MQVRTLIVDDEPPICDEIEFLLQQEPNFLIMGKFHNAPDTLAFLFKNTCDLLFIDIKMPGMSGLELAKTLASLEPPPLIIFSTAFSEHALEAFNTPAVAYITKPITTTSIARALVKVKTLINRQPHQLATTTLTQLCVNKNGHYIPLPLTEISAITVRDKAVYIKTQHDEYTSALTAAAIEELLPGQQFLRVHRQHLVNIDHVAEIIPWFHGSYLLRMKGSNINDIPVSRNKVKALKQRFGMR